MSAKKAKAIPPHDSTVKATPTKRFFVEMLTRDIELDDAVLDLLDNCVDGVLRETRSAEPRPRPYDKYYAHITFSPDQFKIEDNCGGIDRKTAEEYAFLMGRELGDPRDSDLPTVGMYGIGMKRAIFKIGRDAQVISRHAGGWFEVRIPYEWFERADWDLYAHGLLAVDPAPLGTTILVKKLQQSVRDQFGKRGDFEERLFEKLRSHYAFIMHKGFTVTVNGKKVQPRPMTFFVSSPPSKKNQTSLTPYMWDASIDGVKVELTVGLYRPLASEDEAVAEMEAKRSREDAGWTIICNDRVVVHCDKTRLTGWGEVNVPNFHAQFNSIAGIVTFSSAEPLKLPITTTKRGIDSSSDLYLRVKDRMREGTKVFTTYTSKWKQALDEAKRAERQAETVELEQLRSRISETQWTSTRKNGEDGRRFMPTLPEPKPDSAESLIRFHRSRTDVRELGDKLLDDPDAKPSDVGAAAFDRALRDVKK